MESRVGKSLRYSLLLSVPVWCAFVPENARAACSQDASFNVTCSGTVTAAGTVNSGSATTLPITLYDVAAQYQPTGGSNSYTPASYNQNPQPLFVTISSGAQLSATVTTANYANILADKGLITANYSNSENPAVNDVQVANYGSVTLLNEQFATGRASIFNADSQVNNFVVHNYAGASIAVTQTAFTAAPATPGSPSTFSTANLSNSASVATPSSPSTETAKYSGNTLNITTDFYSDDNTNSYKVRNAAGASILATGNYATAYYGRADTVITNSGTIANTTWVPSDTIAAGHWAIAAYAGTDYTPAPNTNPDNSIVIPNADGSVGIDDTSGLKLKNSGTIKGDILALDITPLVYAAAVGTSTNPFPNPSQTTLLQLPVSSGSAGPRDSNITNTGTIQGNVYLGSGTHVLHNMDGATLQGSVYVDQRPFQASFKEPNPGTVSGTYVSAGGTDFNGTTCPAAGQNTTDAGCATTSSHIATVVGGQSLTLTNKGTFTGDIRIFDEATSVNKITLDGTGFAGNVVAVNGTGSNTLILNDVTNLASVQNFSNLNLKQSNVAVAGAVSLVSNANIATTIYGPGGTKGAPSTNVGTINGTLTLAGATTVAPTYKTLVKDGDVYQVASTVTGAGASQVTVKNGGSALVKSSADTSTGQLLLETDVRNASTISGLNQPSTATLNSLLTYKGNNPQVLALGGLVESFGSLAAVREAANALAPIVNGADIQTSINATTLFNQQIDSRLDSFLYAQIPSSGRSADLGVAHPAPVYGVLPPSGAWIEGIGGGAHQSTVAGTNGYTAELEGVIGGYDRLIVPGLRVGGAFGYIDSRVNGQVNFGTREDIQTFQGLAYATYEREHFYVRGSVGDGGVDFQSTRQIAFANFSDIATGSHTGNVFTARGEAGVPYEYLSSLLVPYAAFTYNRLGQSGYTEASGNGAAFTFQSANNDSERSEVGGKVVVPILSAPVFSYLFPTGSVVALEGRAAYVHEFGNVAQTVAASFIGGGNVFIATGPTPSRDMVNYGVGLLMGSGPVQIDIAYSGLARSSYLQQVGLLRARYVF